MFKFEIYSIYFREISIWYPWPEINNYNVVMTNINLLYAIWSIYKISLFIVIIFEIYILIGNVLMPMRQQWAKPLTLNAERELLDLNELATTGRVMDQVR
jgi:hypothetical protein